MRYPRIAFSTHTFHKPAKVVTGVGFPLQLSRWATGRRRGRAAAGLTAGAVGLTVTPAFSRGRRLAASPGPGAIPGRGSTGGPGAWRLSLRVRLAATAHSDSDCPLPPDRAGGRSLRLSAGTAGQQSRRDQSRGRPRPSESRTVPCYISKVPGAYFAYICKI